MKKLILSAMGYGFTSTQVILIIPTKHKGERHEYIENSRIRTGEKLVDWHPLSKDDQRRVRIY